MLPRPIRVVALAAIACGWAPPVHASQSTPFEVVYRALASERIDFVHIERPAPELVLGVYSAQGQLTAWPAHIESEQPRLPALEGQERFVLDRLHRVLGIQSFAYPCLDGTGIESIATETQLRFPKPVWPPPRIPPRLLPDPPIPNPPPPVEGANIVHLSEDGLLALFVRTHLERSQPTEVRIFRRSGPASATFEPSGSYTTGSQGEVQTSRGARLIAQADGVVIRLVGSDGEQRARLDAGVGFRLESAGRWLAVWDHDSVDVTPLDAQTGLPSGATIVFPTESPAHGVRFVGARVLVRERTRVQLFDLTDQSTLWTRTASRGIYTSDAALETTGGQVLVGLGRIEVERPPARRSGAFVPGSARVFVEALDSASDALLAQSAFAIGRWDHDTPSLQFVSGPNRLLVQSSESVTLSPPLP